MILILLVLQISAGAVVARVKEQEMKITDMRAEARLEVTVDGETSERRFDLLMLRDGVNYRAVVEVKEPEAMAGTRFLIHAERGKRNEQWAYFSDLDLVREIPGKRQDDPFLGSDITYADLAGGAHLDDLTHTLIGEEIVAGDPCYVMEGVPRHEIVYGKLRGYVRKADFVTVKAEFFDHAGDLIKVAHLTDIRELGEGVLLAHRIEVRNASEDRASVLTLSNVVVNTGLPAEDFTEDGFARK